MGFERGTLIPPDYHTHHEFCKHAQGRPIEYARAARAAGIAEIAATDHCPTDDGFGSEHRMKLAQFDQYVDDVLAAQADGAARVLLGIEADYYPGCERFLEPWLLRYPFDIVLGSVHFLDYWAPDPARRTLAHGPRPADTWERYFELVGEMAETGLYDVATHLDLPKRFGNAIPIAQLESFARPALRRLAASGMALEINTSGWRHACAEAYPSLTILTWACEAGVGLVFGSDSHQPARVGESFAAAVDLARAAGFRTHRVYRARAHAESPLPD